MAYSRYECDQCGACCRHPIIEVAWLDMLRAPWLREAAIPFAIPAGVVFEEDDGTPMTDPDRFIPGGSLACGPTRPCPLLSAENRCTIYASQPTCCVALQAGSALCQDARAAAGLEPLLPSDGSSRRETLAGLLETTPGLTTGDQLA